MNKFFTYYWKDKDWDLKATDIAFSKPHLLYAASEQFSKRGVRSGDTLFIVNIKGGHLRLGAYIKIHSICDQNAAATALGVPAKELWQAGEYALADKANLCVFRPRLCVYDSVVDGLLFKHGDSGWKSPKRDNSGNLDRQTMRGVRELVPGEEVKLYELLA